MTHTFSQVEHQHRVNSRNLKSALHQVKWLAIAALIAFLAPLAGWPVAFGVETMDVWARAGLRARRVVELVGFDWGDPAQFTWLASLEGAGLWRAIHNLSDWERVGAGVPHDHWRGVTFQSIVALPGQTPLLLGMTAQGFIYRSRDGGENWEPARHPVEIPQTGWLVASQRAVIYVFIGSQLYRSFDTGHTWQAAGTLPYRAWPSCVATDLLGFDSVLAGTSAGQVMISLDGGMNWETSELGVPTARVTDLAGLGGETLFAATSAGIFYSFDRGRTWKQTDDEWVRRPARVILVEDALPHRLFVGLAKGGVLWSTDRGAHWALLGKGLERQSVTALTWEAPGRLIAATRDGIWHYTLPELPTPIVPATNESPMPITQTPSATLAGVSPTPPLATPTPSATYTPAPSVTQTATSTATFTPSPTSSPTFTPSATATPRPSATFTKTPTFALSPTPSETPRPEPPAKPTDRPTERPTDKPSPPPTPPR